MIGSDGSVPGSVPGGEHVETVDGEISESNAVRARMRRRGRRALITDAVRSPEQNRRSRERQYVILQGLRIPFILGAIGAAFAQMWVIASILFVISVPLPWIAVVLGNAKGDPRDSRMKNVYKPAAAREFQRLEMQRRAELESSPSPSHSPATIDHAD